MDDRSDLRVSVRPHEIVSAYYNAAQASVCMTDGPLLNLSYDF